MAVAAPPVALVYRALGLGDLLAAVPALRGVRRALPDHRLLLATDPALVGLVRATGAIDDVVPARELTPFEWRRARPDVVVNLHGRGPQSHRILLPMRPGRLVAFRQAQLGVPGPAWRPDEHETRRWCRLVVEGMSAQATPDDLALAPPPCPPLATDAIVIHPGAAAPARRWPVARFAAVAAWARDTGSAVLVTGSQAERPLAEAVARGARLPQSAVLAGRTTVDALAALVAAARLMVCNDTGAAHLASAFGTPSVVLFGPTSPGLWGPPAEGPHVALWHADAPSPGDPHGPVLDPRLERIQVDEVIAAAETLVAGDHPAVSADG